MLRELREVLNYRKITFIKMFHMMDEEGKGFITLQDFIKKLDEFKKYSVPIKE